MASPRTRGKLVGVVLVEAEYITKIQSCPVMLNKPNKEQLQCSKAMRKIAKKLM